MGIEPTYSAWKTVVQIAFIRNITITYHYCRRYFAGSLSESFFGAGDGNRTHVFSLEGCCSTIELHPLAKIGLKTSPQIVKLSCPNILTNICVTPLICTRY